MPPDQALTYVGADYKTPPRKQVIKTKNKSRLWPFLFEVAQMYHDNLMQTPGALIYLETRGLKIETIKKHKIGYTDGSVLNFTLAFEVQMLIEYGVTNESGYEMMSHRITFPNLPEEGACDFMIGRTVTHEKVKYLGIRTPKPIFGLATAWASPVLFLVEGQFDFLILRQWGYPAVALSGSYVTKDNVAILKQRNVVIIPDNTAQGIGAALGVKAKLGIRAIVLDYASLGTKDIGELGPQDGAKEEFDKLVKEQVPWEYIMWNQTSGQWYRQLNPLAQLR